jgi:cell division protease FtsH
MKRLARQAWLPALVLVIMVVVGVAVATSRTEPPKDLKLSEFQGKVAAREVRNATYFDRDSTVKGELNDGTKYVVVVPKEFSDELTRGLLDSSVEMGAENQRDALWVTLLSQYLPVLLLLGVFGYFMMGMMGGGAGMGGMRLSRNKAKPVDKDAPKVTFADVAGADEAVEELYEIKEFLENPAKFQAIGAKIPKGVLLYGPPGTGKTLLARAVAGEAGAPFFSISGSDFVEMFVGVGASRVRDLFEQAKQNAPAIIFIDEIDAVGRHRGSGTGGGHDEREQTLNQLLVEMDGFDVSTGVILIAATNRPDILDPALLRPGRFDRQIVVDAPDLRGRRAILKVHADGKPLAGGVDLDVIARRTPGFTGADLANTVNEAALLTARHGDETITMHRVEEAIDRVLAGPERKSRVMADKEKLVIAYHEAGHALVGHVLPNTDPIHKVSIIARGRALGWTLALPTEDRNLKTRSELRDEMAMLLGGRTAEEIIFGDPTTGAQNDIERASQIARAMVTQFGMSEVIGPLQLSGSHGDPFLGKGGATGDASYSDEVATAVDTEVRRLVDEAHAEAREILLLHRATLQQLADALVAEETLGDEALLKIFGHLDSWESTGTSVTSERHEPLSRPARDIGAIGAGAGSGPAASSSGPAPGGFGGRREGYAPAEGDGDSPDAAPPRF